MRNKIRPESCWSSGNNCFTKWPGPEKDIPHQALNQVDWLDVLQRVLLANTPPHMYDDMKTHLQEMLDIGAIWNSHSPWASTVVLLQKKDGSLRLTSGSWTMGPSKMPTCYPTSMRPQQSAGVPIVLLIWPEVWLLASQDGWGKQTTDHVYCGAIGILQVW